MKPYIFLLTFVSLFSSCSTSKAPVSSNLAPLKEVSQLNGVYANSLGSSPTLFEGTEVNFRNTKTILAHFNIYEYSDSVRITVSNPDSIKLTYYTRHGSKDITFPGRLRKDHYEVYVERKANMVSSIFCKQDVETVRIGKTQTDGLYISKFGSKL